MSGHTDVTTFPLPLLLWSRAMPLVHLRTPSTRFVPLYRNARGGRCRFAGTCKISTGRPPPIVRCRCLNNDGLGRSRSTHNAAAD
jgi:hypothetical protein